jgi:propanol-preferring alcohol dehydrogenase
MAENVTVPARHLAHLGDLDPVSAAPLTDAALTPYHAIALSRDRLGPSSTVAVIGVGGLGHMAVQILQATSAATVVAIDTDEGRLRHATELGAGHAVPSDDHAPDEVLRLTAGRGADVVLDFVGSDATLALAAGCVATAGHVTVVGLAEGGLPVPAAAPPPAGLPWGCSVTKPYGGTRRDFQEVLALGRAGRIAVHVERFGLDEAASVLDRLERGDVDGRAVLVP